MLKVTKLGSAGAAEYYGRDDYFVTGEAGQPGLVWGGRGAAVLGHEKGSLVDPKDFKALLEGRNPDPAGPALSKADAREREKAETGEDGTDLTKHAPGWDLTFSMPKWASVLALVGGEDALRGAWAESVDVAMKFIEDELAVTRLREDGSGPVERQGESLVWCKVEHLISRAQDPNIHIHVIVPNMVFMENGDVRAFETRQLYKYQQLAGSIAQMEFRQRANDLGFNTKDDPAGKGITELIGFDPDHANLFSRRAAQIEANIAEQQKITGRELSDEQRHLMRFVDRPDKQRVSLNDLKPMWTEVERENGFDSRQLVAEARERGRGRHEEDKVKGSASDLYSKLLNFVRPEEMSYSTPRGALQYGLAHCEERSAVFTKHDVLAAAMAGANYQFQIADYLKAYDQVVDKGIILPADKSIANGITTARAVELEQGVIAAMQAERGASTVPFDRSRIASLLTPEGLQGLDIERVPSAGQREVVEQALFSTDGVLAVQGHAGVGKTTTFATLARAVENLSDGETKIHALAPANKAVGALKAQAGLEGMTVARFLNEYNMASQEGEAGLAVLRGTYQDQWLLVDESSQLSNVTMKQILEAKRALGIDKVIFAGDVNQLPSVSAGAPLRLIIYNDVQTLRMNEIVRQKDETLKAGIYELADGKPSRALETMAPYIHQTGSPDHSALALKAMEVWRERAAGKAFPKVVVATNEMRHIINAAVRHELKEAGVLAGEGFVQKVFLDLNMTEAQRSNSRSYNVGQYLQTFAADKGADLKANQLLRIDGVDVRNNRLVLADDQGQRRSLDLDDKASRGRLDFGVRVRSSLEINEGDDMRFTANDRRRAISSGDTFKVLASNRDTVTIRGEDGVERTLSRFDPMLRSVAHDYAITADLAQGATYKDTIAIFPSALGEFASNARAYVMASRPKEGFALVTDDVADLARKLATHLGINKIALEHLPDNVRQSMDRERPNPERGNPGIAVDLHASKDATQLGTPIPESIKEQVQAKEEPLGLQEQPQPAGQEIGDYGLPRAGRAPKKDEPSRTIQREIKM